MVIASILKTKGNRVVSLAPDQTILEAARLLAEHRIGAALVRDPAGELLGILSERDIVGGMAAHGPGTTGLKATQFMTRDLVTIRPETLVTEALSLMTQRRVRHLPVLDASGGLVGLVSIGDLVKHKISEIEAEAQTLKNYIAAG